MNRQFRGIFLFGLTLLFLVSIVQARVNYRGDNLQTDYGAGDQIKGYINISFNKTNLDSTVRTNFANNTIKLRDLLSANGFEQFNDYNCTTANCLPGYTRRELIDSVNFDGRDTIVGFSLQGSGIHNIQGASMIISSDAAPSCFLNLGLDVLNQNRNLITTNRYTSESCYEPRYGCFERTGVEYSSLIMDAGTEYCERITLPIAPGFVIGANITDKTSGTAGIKMRLRSMAGSLLSECNLPALSQATQDVECLVPYSSALQQDFLVCVLPYGPGSNYKIRAETHSPCGTTDGGASYPGDYEIHAKNLQFDSPRIELSSNYFSNVTGLNLNEYIESYLSDTYGGNCLPSCIVPFRIFGIPQNLQITNPYLRYTTSLGGSSETNLIYRVESSNVSVDSDLLSVRLDLANFTIPFGASDDHLDIFIDGDRVVRKSINLSNSFDFSLNPQFVSFGRDTKFSGISRYNISYSSWSFGDGSATQNANGPNINHRYLQQGEFNVAVSLTRVDGAISRRNFLVVVGDAKTTANASLIKMRQQMTNISRTIDSYPSWMHDDLKFQLGYNALNSSLRENELAFANARNSSDYETVATQVFSLDFPKQIRAFKKGVVPLIIGAGDLNTAPLQATSHTDISNNADLNKAIVDWMTKNTAATIEFEQIAVEFNSRTLPLATKFGVSTKPRTVFGEGVNLYLNYGDKDIIFASNTYNAKGLEGATVVPLQTNDQKIEFMILDSIQPEEIGAYISPEVSELGDFSEGPQICNGNNKCEASFGETRSNCSSDCKPWGTIILIFVALIITGLVAWLGIMWWYRTRYESSLFPNKQDLVNIMSFISASALNNLSDKDMRARLKKSGWTGEQIAYAIKKYRKSKGSINRFQTDGRFIKRPDFNS